MELDLIINSNVTIPGAELSVSVSRSSGPGGQHVNKTSSRVSLRWNIKNSQALTEIIRNLLLHRLSARLVGEGELLVHVESERSQLRNREIARERLAEVVRKALKISKKRIATKPTHASKDRRVSNKKRRGIIKKLRKLDSD